MRSEKKINAVAIDGPAGSGKSTVSRKVANKLGYTYIDTGAMYRALTLKIMEKNIDLEDSERIIRESGSFTLELQTSGMSDSTIRVLLDSRDVSDLIRDPEVTRNVKYVAVVPEVRANLVKMQQKMIASLDGSVMEGRDIGTVVIPDARYKIFLDASFSERVERRYRELMAKGNDVIIDEVAKDLEERDNSDYRRAVGPLKMADDAHRLDTTGMSIDEVVDAIVSVVHGDRGGK
ncbi:MAG: (d)CMP kinase [Candidatus Omnitrophica bacterium]|nr:(d)CMP kinase [Candidatus Omnitrophota bacterium]